MAMILEPGKEYITNNNNRLLVHWVGDEYAFGVLIVNDHKTPVCWWLSDKEYIIGPWNPKPVVDWSLYSKWTKAVAQIGMNRIWVACNSIPLKTYNCYYVDGLNIALTYNCYYVDGLNIALKIPPEYAPKSADGTPWVGNWEDSLVVREED